MLYLAALGEGRAKAAEIAAACKAPMSSIQQVLQALTRARLLGSNSSAAGGYELRADPGQVSILQIIEAVEGPVDGDRCMLSAQPCHLLERCPIHRVWARAVTAFRAGLSEASLAEILADEAGLRAGTVPERVNPQDGDDEAVPIPEEPSND